MNENEILDLLKKILYLPKKTILDQIGKGFFSQLGFPNYMWRNERVIRIMIKQSRRILELTGGENKDILEIGCGMGFHAIFAALSGAAQVTAVDYIEEHIIMMNNMISVLNVDELYDKLRTVRCDARYLPLKDNMYDVIQTLDVLSHCQNIDPLISEIRRVARGDASIYILDNNNGLKLGESKEIVHIQQLAEKGPLEIAHKQGRCIGIRTSYSEMREKIIHKHFPELNNDTVAELAEKTSGIYGKDIMKAVNDLRRRMDGSIYRETYPDVCVVRPHYRHPENGMWPEIAFSPFKLKNYLNSKGLLLRLLPYQHIVLSGGLKGLIKRVLARIVSTFYPATILFAPGFELLGRVKKKGDPMQHDGKRTIC